MPSNVFYGMQHINENVLCAIVADLVSDHRQSEVIEVGIVPLDSKLEVHDKIPLFNVAMKPFDLDAVDRGYCRQPPGLLARILLNGPSHEQGIDQLETWFKELKLPTEKKRVLPLAYNWPLTRERLIRWCGFEMYTSIFSEDYRDVLACAHIFNDRAASSHDNVPFSKQSLRWIAKKMHIEQSTQGGTCLEDCRTIATIYKRMLVSGIS